MMAKKLIPNSGAEAVRKRISEADIQRIAKAFADYDGTLEVFESAIGALLVGRMVGFDALRIVHGSRTLRNYEKILGGISFRRELAPRTEDSLRVKGIRYAEGFKQFW